MWNKRRHGVYQRQLTRRLFVRFIAALAGVVLLIVMLAGLWKVVYSFSTLYWTLPNRNAVLDWMFSTMARLRTWVGADLVVIGLFLSGLLAVVWLLLRQATRYLGQLVEAASSLAEPTETPIELSYELQGIQDELNLARERSLRNAMLAREAEQRKNDLVVYLAHDLKTPLTSVIGYLSLLRDEPDISPALRARYTGIALNKAERLESLINEFFDITRFSLTTLTLEKERVNLSRMLEQTASEFDPTLGEKDLSWRLDIAPGVDAVCDPDKMARLFDNLIRNAVNYSYPHTELAMSLRGEGDSAVIRLQNRGRTIPPEKLERIFEQFFRLDTSRGTSTGGAGLGLAIARQIVQAHGGTIRAESADEQIVFTVSLPL